MRLCTKTEYEGFDSFINSSQSFALRLLWAFCAPPEQPFEDFLKQLIDEETVSDLAWLLGKLDGKDVLWAAREALLVRAQEMCHSFDLSSGQNLQCLDCRDERAISTSIIVCSGGQQAMVWLMMHYFNSISHAALTHSQGASHCCFSCFSA